MRGRHALRFARVLLLLALALGVCGMHTLGHLSGGHGGSSPGGHGMAVAHTDGPAGLGVVAPAPGLPGFDPTDVCTAILTALMVLLLIAVRIRVRRRHGDALAALLPVRQIARPPPRPTSRRLAGLSILRI